MITQVYDGLRGVALTAAPALHLAADSSTADCVSAT